MNINQLITIIKNKIEETVITEDIKIEDKSFLHKDHKNNQKGKFHIKLTIKSNQLSKLNKIERTKKIYNIISLELKENIHSIQILII